MRRHLAIVACLAVTGSFADAAPGRRAKVGKQSAKHRAKVASPLEQAEAARADDDDEAKPPRRTKRVKRTKRQHVVTERARGDAEHDRDRVAFSDIDDKDATDAAVDDGDRVSLDAPVRLRKLAKAPAKDWHVAIGPYLWASSVDADVSLGSASVSTGVDFFQLQRHAKYGVEVLGEARYGRFAFYGDLMYGVVGVDGATEVGPLMVTLGGTASSLLVDGVAGYMVAGGERSLLSLEARAGVRYQRTDVSGSVNVAGSEVLPTTYVDAAADALAGAHVVVRPFRRFYVSGTADVGVFGASTSTWSAAGDASVHITSRVRLSLGWRTLTTARTNVSIVMHGPRAALQLMF